MRPQSLLTVCLLMVIYSVRVKRKEKLRGMLGDIYGQDIHASGSRGSDDLIIAFPKAHENSWRKYYKGELIVVVIDERKIPIELLTQALVLCLFWNSLSSYIWIPFPDLVAIEAFYCPASYYLVGCFLVWFTGLLGMDNFSKNNPPCELRPVRPSPKKENISAKFAFNE